LTACIELVDSVADVGFASYSYATLYQGVSAFGLRSTFVGTLKPDPDNTGVGMVHNIALSPAVRPGSSSIRTRDPMYKTLFTLSLLACSVAAYAQESAVNDTSKNTPPDIERVVVSGDFRQTTLDQLSASATILDQERLRSRQPSHIDSVLNSIPNVNFAAGASRGRFVQIRGIGAYQSFGKLYRR